MAASIQTFATLVHLAWRNVFRNWRHSLATLLTIGCGFVAIALFDGFLNDLDEKNYDGYTHRGMLGQVEIVKRGAFEQDLADPWQYSLDQKDQAFIKGFLDQDSDVINSVRYLNLSGIANGKDHSGYFIGYGYDLIQGRQMRGDRWAWDTLAGEPLDQERQASIVIGRGFAKILGCMPPGPLPLQKSGQYQAVARPLSCDHPRLSLSTTTETAQINLLEFPIQGIIDAGSLESDRLSIHMSLESAQRLMDTDKISMISVDLKSQNADAFIKRFESASLAAGMPFQVIHWWEHPFSANARGGIQILKVFRNLFMCIVALVGAMSIANSMMKSVNERTREIGMLRSLGFRRKDVLGLFGLEGFLTSLFACAFGLILALVLSRMIAALGISFDAGFLSLPIRLQIYNSPRTYLISATLLSVVASLTSFICVRRAGKMKIAEALRYA
jgi:putative ABC transport system permease protein